jgi:hypothetical protein
LPRKVVAGSAGGRAGLAMVGQAPTPQECAQHDGLLRVAGSLSMPAKSGMNCTYALHLYVCSLYAKVHLCIENRLNMPKGEERVEEG